MVYYLFRIESFYSTAVGSEEILGALSEMGCTLLKLTELSSEVIKTKELYLFFQKSIADALAASAEKKKRVKIMDTWMTDFYRLAKVAIGLDNLLELLGFEVSQAAVLKADRKARKEGSFNFD